MKLSNLLQRPLIVPQLKSKTKKEVFEELAALICSQYPHLNKQAILDVVYKREAQQSTYLGHGLALPHARLEGLKDFIVACGCSKDGIRFEETSDTVKFVFMILSCKTKINTLLQTMGALATVFSDAGLIHALEGAATPDAFIHIIEQSKVSIKQTLVAKDIMHTSVITLSPQQTLKEVIDLFFNRNISGAPVLADDKTVMGVVTEKEIINVGLPQYMKMMDNISFLKEFEPFEEIFKREDEILVKDIYSKEFVFVHEEVPVIQLAFYFVNKSCRRILVLDDKERLRGIIMRKDVIRKVIRA